MRGQLLGQIIEVLRCPIHLLHAFLRLACTLIDILHRPCDLIHSSQLMARAGRNLLGGRHRLLRMLPDDTDRIARRLGQLHTGLRTFGALLRDHHSRIGGLLDFTQNGAHLGCGLT